VGVLDADDIEVFLPVGQLFLEGSVAVADFNPFSFAVVAQPGFFHVAQVFVASHGAGAERAGFDGPQQSRFFAGLDAGGDEVTHRCLLFDAVTNRKQLGYPYNTAFVSFHERPAMPLDWTSFVSFVREHQRFLLTTHIRPDCDGLGSLLALGEALQHLGKTVRPLIASAWPPRYDFLDPTKTIERFTLPGDTWRDVDAVIILDTGTKNQLGDFASFLASLPVAKIVIDHHLSQDDLGATRFVDVTAEATGRLVYEALGAQGCALTPAMAHNLFAAVATDTGWFRHNNATAPTFGLCEKLVAAGARPTDLYEHLYEHNSLARVRLMGLVLSRLQLTDESRVAYTHVERNDYETTGAQPQDTEELVNYPRSISGVQVGLFFMEQPRGGIKVSLRSRLNIDVAKVAEGFGGGGHRQAAGAVIDGTMPEARTRVLAAVHKALSGLSDGKGH
jgi:bifunctional oligoribonuclease and PAP phosphatase NrnA